ncbi:thiamine monophosphate synthase/TENI family protein [Campylobacter showae]|uniref:Putative thiamine-phosphate diphosphorylase n=1 Tax=Campylobacter showae RM3277 TaxID=553219 RepID=C6RDJ3_9BACT|nr:thiamine phosphate synthase [Campylobacter showae]EET80554.1 putative thiamine-phosphate diphosphorylase [Campylobacter showae RM3277]QCD49266.1 thiamine monophosphate synthase/TENI family protein [Campylobacter showae]
MKFDKFELVWVTNRRLSEDFFADVRRVAQSGKADKILLRESDLPEHEYEKLASKTLEIIAECDSGARLVLHTHASVASKLGVGELHLPFAKFRALSSESATNLRDLAKFDGVRTDKERGGGICASNLTQKLKIGVSVHSLQEALTAQDFGADYVVAGHIFDTPSHALERGRGLKFLREICENLSIKTYAIGGINFENLDKIKDAGAAGAYMMRGFLS